MVVIIAPGPEALLDSAGATEWVLTHWHHKLKGKLVDGFLASIVPQGCILQPSAWCSKGLDSDCARGAQKVLTLTASAWRVLVWPLDAAGSGNFVLQVLAGS